MLPVRINIVFVYLSVVLLLAYAVSFGYNQIESFAKKESVKVAIRKIIN